jgi:hypothetical protein
MVRIRRNFYKKIPIPCKDFTRFPLPPPHIRSTMDGEECAKAGERCGCRCRWPIVVIATIALFAIGFGVRTCTIAGDEEKVVEETAYRATSFFQEN